MPTLSRFLGRNLFPRGPLLLTDWGPTPDRWFRSGLDHKRTNLRRLAEEFPQLRWLLIGDDGQHDEELYGEFADDHPDHVSAVAIRQLTPARRCWPAVAPRPRNTPPASRGCTRRTARASATSWPSTASSDPRDRVRHTLRSPDSVVACPDSTTAQPVTPTTAGSAVATRPCGSPTRASKPGSGRRSATRGRCSTWARARGRTSRTTAR